MFFESLRDILSWSVVARWATALLKLFLRLGVARMVPFAAFAAGELSLMPWSKSRTLISSDMISPY